MNQDTPAREIRSSDLAKNTAAFVECYRALGRRKIESVTDIRYGLGGWAKALRDENCYAQILGFEPDPETLRRSFRDERTLIHNCPFPSEIEQEATDLLLADFNNLTMLKAEPLLEAIQITNPRIVIFTDVACSKMHLNFKSYGLQSPSLQKYFERFRNAVLPKWRLLHTARLHHHAATTAWIR